MARCATCGNEHDKIFRVVMAHGESHVFDSFECAIQALAPVCEHCGCRIIGYGVEVGESYFCCSHCAVEADRNGTRDRAELSQAVGARPEASRTGSVVPIASP